MLEVAADVVVLVVVVGAVENIAFQFDVVVRVDSLTGTRILDRNVVGPRLQQQIGDCAGTGTPAAVLVLLGGDRDIFQRLELAALLVHFPEGQLDCGIQIADGQRITASLVDNQFAVINPIVVTDPVLRDDVDADVTAGPGFLAGHRDGVGAAGGVDQFLCVVRVVDRKQPRIHLEVVFRDKLVVVADHFEVEGGAAGRRQDHLEGFLCSRGEVVDREAFHHLFRIVADPDGDSGAVPVGGDQTVDRDGHFGGFRHPEHIPVRGILHSDRGVGVFFGVIAPAPRSRRDHKAGIRRNLTIRFRTGVGEVERVTHGEFNFIADLPVAAGIDRGDTEDVVSVAELEHFAGSLHLLAVPDRRIGDPVLQQIVFDAAAVVDGGIPAEDRIVAGRGHRQAGALFPVGIPARRRGVQQELRRLAVRRLAAVAVDGDDPPLADAVAGEFRCNGIGRNAGDHLLPAAGQHIMQFVLLEAEAVGAAVPGEGHIASVRRLAERGGRGERAGVGDVDAGFRILEFKGSGVAPDGAFVADGIDRLDPPVNGGHAGEQSRRGADIVAESDALSTARHGGGPVLDAVAAAGGEEVPVVGELHKVADAGSIGVVVAPRAADSCSGDRGGRIAELIGIGDLADGHHRFPEADEAAHRGFQVGISELSVEVVAGVGVGLVADVVHRVDPVVVETAFDGGRPVVVVVAGLGLFSLGDNLAGRVLPGLVLELVFDHVLLDVGLGVARVAPAEGQLELHVVGIAPVGFKRDPGLLAVPFLRIEGRRHVVPHPDPEIFAAVIFRLVVVDVGGLDPPVDEMLVGQTGNGRFGGGHRLRVDPFRSVAAVEDRIDLVLVKFDAGAEELHRVVLDRVAVRTFRPAPGEARDRGGDAGAFIIRVDDVGRVARKRDHRGGGIDQRIVRDGCSGLPLGDRRTFAVDAADLPGDVADFMGGQPLDLVIGGGAGEFDHHRLAVDGVLQFVLFIGVGSIPGEGHGTFFLVDGRIERRAELFVGLDPVRLHENLSVLVPDIQCGAVELPVAVGDLPVLERDGFGGSLIDERDALAVPVGRSVSIVFEKRIGLAADRIIEVDGQCTGTGQGDVVEIAGRDDRTADVSVVKHELNIQLPFGCQKVARHLRSAVDEDAVLIAAEVDVAVDDGGAGKFDLVFVVRRNVGRVGEHTGFLVIGPLGLNRRVRLDRTGDSEI